MRRDAQSCACYRRDHKESGDEGNTSVALTACSNVSEGCTLSTAGSDDHDQREGGDVSPLDDDFADSGPESGSDTQDHGSDEEVLWKGADWAKEASEDSFETSSGVLSPMSARSEPAVEDILPSEVDSESQEVACEAASNKAEAAFSAAVLRWDAERGSWVPGEILITAPPPLRRFAVAFPGIDNEVKTSACRHQHLDTNTSARSKACSKAKISSMSSEDFFARVSEEYSKASTTSWPVRHLSSTATPFTPMTTWGTRPNPNAEIFVPSEGGLGGQLNSQRTRLSSRAAHFVPLY